MNNTFAPTKTSLFSRVSTAARGYPLFCPAILSGFGLAQIGAIVAGVISLATLTVADTVFFSTGDPDGKMATGSRPSGPGTEIEAADDFVLSQSTVINQATFTGLLPSGAPLSSVDQVVVEIYKVFPKDSNNPPDGRVPTRVNSPSDNAFDSRDSAAAGLTFKAVVVNSSFTAGNSVLNGINPKPNQKTGGEGAVTGQEVELQVNFTAPFDLPADHYFFVPQVKLSNGNFFWLSAPKPIVSPGTPFAPDLQSWIRNAALDPDWLRIGTDIEGNGRTFNAAFSLTGSVPDSSSSALLIIVGCLGLVGFRSISRWSAGA